MSGPFADASTGTVTWEATGWDDPRVADLRAQMDREVVPRYAGRSGTYPAGPTADEVAVVWLALVEGVPAATATLRRLEVPGQPPRSEVKRLFVAAGHRRRGLAALALGRVEGSARADGVPDLVLQTGDLQPDAEALYVREGWHRVPVYPPYDGLVHSRCYGKTL